MTVLRKIVSIKNVGRFLNYGAGGEVELKRYNLVFAENGRGKTTLCAILRSLHSGDPAHVRGRRTLGSTGAAEIRILFDSGTATFSKGVWSTAVSELAIFDSTFVAENVYSGDTVDLDHRRSLYKVIVGKQGVALARRIDELDAASREKNTDIREKRAAVQALVPQGIAIEAFLLLKDDPAIDAKIAIQERELEAVRQADQIKSRAAMAELALPALPVGFQASLGKTIDGIAEDAERRVAAQIQAHGMHEQGRTWLSEGLGYIGNNLCPFCGQSLQGLALIAAYKAYFSEASRRPTGSALSSSASASRTPRSWNGISKRQCRTPTRRIAGHSPTTSTRARAATLAMSCRRSGPCSKPTARHSAAACRPKTTPSASSLPRSAPPAPATSFSLSATTLRN